MKADMVREILSGVVEDFIHSNGDKFKDLDPNEDKDIEKLHELFKNDLR